jgi:tetratricopeptide (TPR) repeat protein
VLSSPETTRSTLLAIAVFVVALGVYLVTLPPDILPGDSGELIAASYMLGIAHPPGFPLYLVLGKLFSSVFAFGSIAYRYNLFSAVTASAAAGLAFLVLVRIGVGRVLGAGVAIGLATLGSYWLQATTGDVYALNGLLTALMLYVALLSKRYGERALLLVSLIGGLAVSHHLTLVYGLASALVVLAFRIKGRPRGGTIVLSIFLFCLGLSTWLYIPIRSGRSPALAWGDASSLSGFLNHVTAESYRWRLRTFDIEHRALDLLRYFKVLARASGAPLAFLACVGVVLNLRRFRLIGGFLLLIACYAFHYTVYNIPDIDSHIFPALLGVAALAGLALQRIDEWPRRPGAGRAAAIALAAAVVVVSLVQIHPRRDQWFAADYARAIEQSAVKACGEDCIVVCTGDMSFPLLYATFTGTSSVRAFFVGLSDPGSVGIVERPTTIEGWIAAAMRKYGSSGVALFGDAPPQVMGRPTRICGMVHVIGEAHGECASPLELPVRGAGQDLRDYASRLLSGNYYLHLARWCIEQQDAAGARELIARALAAGYDDVKTHLEASRVYRSIGMAAEARQALDLALRIDPDFFETHDMLAGLALEQGDAGEAIREYRNALKGNPHPAPLYSNLGNAYLARGDYAGALESFNKALALDSTLVNACVGIGRGLEAQGKTEEALSYYERGRRLDPAGEAACHAEASLLLKLGRYEQARRLIRESLGDRPGGAFLLSDLGLAFLREGVPDSAIVYLRAALAADPSMLSARGNLAVAYASKGLETDAIEQYRIYLETAPAGQMRDRAAEALKDLLSGR